MRSLTSEQALRKTFELVAEAGPQPANLDALFAGLDADAPDALDGVRDLGNMPLDQEPVRVRADLEAVLDRRSPVTA